MAKKLYLPKNIILTEDISEDYLFAAILKENKLAITEKNIDILAEAIVNGSVVLVERVELLEMPMVNHAGHNELKKDFAEYPEPRTIIYGKDKETEEAMKKQKTFNGAVNKHGTASVSDPDVIITHSQTYENKVPYNFEYVSDEEAEKIKERAKAMGNDVKTAEASKEDLDKLVKKKNVGLYRRKGKSNVLVEDDTNGQVEAKKEVEAAKGKKQATHSAAKKVAIGALTGAAVGALAGHAGGIAADKLGSTWDNDAVKKVGEWAGEHKGATAGIGAGAGAAVGMGAGVAKAAHDAKKDENAANEKLAKEDKKVADEKAAKIKNIDNEINTITAQLTGEKELSDSELRDLRKRMKELKAERKKLS